MRQTSTPPGRSSHLCSGCGGSAATQAQGVTKTNGALADPTNDQGAYDMCASSPIELGASHWSPNATSSHEGHTKCTDARPRPTRSPSACMEPPSVYGHPTPRRLSPQGLGSNKPCVPDMAGELAPACMQCHRPWATNAERCCGGSLGEPLETRQASDDSDGLWLCVQPVCTPLAG